MPARNKRSSFAAPVAAQRAPPDQAQSRLGHVLLAKGLISRDDLSRALRVQLRTRDRLGRILMSLDLVHRRQLYPVLAEMWGVPFVDLLDEKPQEAAVRLFDAQTLLEHRFVPMRLLVGPTGKRRLFIATSDAPNDRLTDLVRSVAGKDVSVEYCATTDWDIDKTLGKIFRDEMVVEATTGLYQRSPEESAFRPFRRWQVATFVLALLVLAGGLVLRTTLTLIVVSAAVNLCFLICIMFKVVTSIAGLRVSALEAVSDDEVAALEDRDLPTYTILVPVYHEANIVSKLLDNLGSIDYPSSKLEILLLLEEDDEETISAARKAKPSETVTFVIVPESLPRTKPRACNVGLFFARGEYLVIYDAEDRPEPDQLKKAYIAFRKGAPNLVCVQAALNYFNSKENFLTRMFTLEYSYWFDYMLHGLARLGLPIPLGGTSNHFRTDLLRDLGGWDPYNVTEDADLGIRAAARGYKVGVINSTTYEEANTRVGNWIRQRSRWIKGYMQTTLVYLRNPARFVRQVGIKDALGFAMLVGGTPLTFLATLPMWVLFTAWAGFGLPLDRLYPEPILYVGLANLILGNLLMVAVNALGVIRRRNFDLALFALANPLYWTLHSIASYKAAWQLITRPFYWEKTEHGLTANAEGHEAAEPATEITVLGPAPSIETATGQVIELVPPKDEDARAA